MYNNFSLEKFEWIKWCTNRFIVQIDGLLESKIKTYYHGEDTTS